MSKVPNKKRIQDLSEKWLDGTITIAEKQEYDLWYNSFKDHEVSDLAEEDLTKLQVELYQDIQRRENISYVYLKNRRIKGLKRIALFAASISLFIFSVAYLYYSFIGNTQKSQEKYFSSVLPGRDKATLSLDNGTVFELNSLKNGEILQEAGVRIEKTEAGELIYSILDPLASENKEVLMNTVSTPRGGQYRISLPDGSQVWLNSASSLKFPTVFTGKNRIVELAGEAYFEVAKNKNKPFKVITENEEVEVLGTHFNVSSYKEEETSSVALLEGKVKVSLHSAASKVLIPGQQSVVKAGSIEVYPIDLSEVAAWKNGEFMFNNENIKSVMQKVARWYDVEVVLAPEIEDISIWGSVSRYEKLEEVLKIIALTHEALHFKIDGRRIYVMK